MLLDVVICVFFIALHFFTAVVRISHVRILCVLQIWFVVLDMLVAFTEFWFVSQLS